MISTVRFHRDPLGFLERERRRSGDVFTLRLAIAGPVAVVAEPEAAIALVESDPERAHAGEARRSIVPMASASSVFGGDGDTHRTARQRLAGVFTEESLAGRREAIAAIAERHAAAWPTGRPFPLLSRMRTLVDDVFVRIMLGVADEARARALVEAVGRMLRTPGNPPLPPPGEGDGLLGALGRRLFEWRRRPLARLLVEEIDERRTAPSTDGDAIAALLDASDRPSTEQIVDEIVTLLMAAQEPPSIALAWMLERLSRDSRLAADYLESSEGSAFREAVLSESLRMRPSSLGVMRRLTRPLEAGGEELAAGMNAMVPIPLVQRDERFFPAPGEFRPDRWVDTGPPPPLYLPFGGGARRCLGEPLARAEVAAVVPAVMRTVRLRPLWPRRERMVVRGTVLVPHRSVPVVATEAAV